jgi:hypothetical protein
VWNAAYGGMPLGDGATLLAGGGEAPSNVALVVIGYHNTRSEVAAGRFPARIDAIVGAAGGRLVVWPMLGSTPECSASYKRAVVRANEELQAALQRWSNLALVDYPTFLAGHDEYAVNDCPHLRAAGYRATATWLAGEVRGVVEHRRSAS